tara:strand:- start:33 stop:359 length:327 start_codon:yes stop_codon:yes gene_type:complete
MNYLVFIDAADDAATYPASRLLGMTCAGDGALLLKFEGTAQDTTVEEDNIDLITLTITADKEKDVMMALAKKFNDPVRLTGGSIVVCDDVNSVFAHANILSCTITLDA